MLNLPLPFQPVRNPKVLVQLRPAETVVCFTELGGGRLHLFWNTPSRLLYSLPEAQLEPCNPLLNRRARRAGHAERLCSCEIVITSARANNSPMCKP